MSLEIRKVSGANTVDVVQLAVGRLEKIKELLRLAQEQGYLTYNDINDALPDNIQWALFPEGGFIHVDSGSLVLGIVRDSTLNSTNDYQFFGETFENVARIEPAQACYWVTSDICASGQFPPAGTVRTCD